MIDYSKAFSKLRELGLITDNSIIAIGSTLPKRTATSSAFGAMGALVSALANGDTRIYYAIVADNTKIRFYDLEKESGSYTNSYLEILKSNLTKFKVKKNKLVFKTEHIKETIVFPKKINGFSQDENTEILYDFLYQNYKK